MISMSGFMSEKKLRCYKYECIMTYSKLDVLLLRHWFFMSEVFVVRCLKAVYIMNEWLCLKALLLLFVLFIAMLHKPRRASRSNLFVLIGAHDCLSQLCGLLNGVLTCWLRIKPTCG